MTFFSIFLKPYVSAFNLSTCKMTCGVMARLQLPKQGCLRPATRFCQRTARMKRTTAWRVDGRGNITRQNDALALGILVHHRYGGNQRLRVRMFGRTTDGFGQSGLDNAAKVHNQYAAADVLHHRQIVRHKQVSKAMLLLQVPQQVDDLRLHGYIESTDGFVANDEPGLDSQGASDADALSLATAEFMRVTSGVRGVEPDIVKQVLDSTAALSRAIS